MNFSSEGIRNILSEPDFFNRVDKLFSALDCDEELSTSQSILVAGLLVGHAIEKASDTAMYEQREMRNTIETKARDVDAALDNIRAQISDTNDTLQELVNAWKES